MPTSRPVRPLLALGIGALLLLLPAAVLAQQAPAAADDCAGPAASNPASWSESFNDDTVGADPRTFLPFVGSWSVAVDGDNKVLLEDGGKWDESSAAAGVAEQAKALYGDRYAEFLDNVQNYAYFPFVVAKGVDNFGNGTICMRFKPIDGRVDQAGGIIFDVKENGDYLILRGNAVENNFVLFRYVQGVRTVVKWIRNVDTPTAEWHQVKLVVNGTALNGYFDGKMLLDWTLDEPVSGKVGLWSKADSVVYFDDLRVVPAAS
jgi:hypothetical protein